MRCSIVGAGNGGLAFAALMAMKNIGNVTLYDVDVRVIDPLKAEKTIFLQRQNATDPVHIFRVTTDPREAVDDADLIMVVTPASFHSEVAQSLGPYIKNGATVVLNPGRTGGAMEFCKVLSVMGRQQEIVVAEAQTLLFACRKTKPLSVDIKGIKKAVPVAAFPAKHTKKVVETLNCFFPQFVEAENVLETSLNNIGAIFHPTPTLLNVARIECGERFQYYHEGISPSVAALLEAIDRERVAVATAFSVKTQSALQWLNHSYDIDADCLYNAIQANISYKGISAPSSIRVRYVSEDVPTGLVPLMEFARLANVDVPYIRTIIQLANGLSGTDYTKTGRTLASMGIEGMSIEEVWQHVS